MSRRKRSNRALRNRVWFVKHGPAERVPCYWCGKPLLFDAATVEHLKERFLGGSNKMENLEIACCPCNWNHSRWLNELLVAVDARMKCWVLRLKLAHVRMKLLRESDVQQ